MYNGLRKAATKVVRRRSDRRSRYMDKDQSKETKNQALIPALTLIVLLSQTINYFRMRVPLCYYNKVPDELATLSILDSDQCPIELAHKASAVRYMYM